MYHLPYENATFTWDELQEFVVPMSIKFLTQLSDQDEYAVAFSTAMQQDTNDLIQSFDTSAVQYNTNDFFSSFDTSAVSQAEPNLAIAEPMVHQCLITALDSALPFDKDDDIVMAEGSAVEEVESYLQNGMKKASATK